MEFDASSSTTNTARSSSKPKSEKDTNTALTAEEKAARRKRHKELRREDYNRARRLRRKEQQDCRNDGRTNSTVQTNTATKTKPAQTVEDRFLQTNFYALLDGADKPDEPLYKSVTSLEHDALVGWATHITHCDKRNVAHNKKSNPLQGSLMDLPSHPLPPSMLALLTESAAQHMTQQPQEVQDLLLNHLYKAFDQSALVSLGMCVEDMVTATFLPLAQAHVARCRNLSEGNTESGSEQPNKTESAWEQWTLPPEECILRLARVAQSQEQQQQQPTPPNTPKEPLPHLPTMAPAVLTAVSSEAPQSVLNQPLPGEPERLAKERWRKEHGYNAEYVEDNQDIFAVFEPGKTR